MRARDLNSGHDDPCVANILPTKPNIAPALGPATFRGSILVLLE